MDYTPEFQNDHTSVLALGLAVAEDGYNGEMFYASAVGPENSLKSIFASLVTNGELTTYARPWFWNEMYLSKEGRTQLWSSLPYTANRHAVFVSDQSEILLVTAGREDFQAIDGDLSLLDEPEVRKELLAGHEPALIRRFRGQLNELIDIPVRAEWAEPLWHAAVERQAVLTVDTFGDCLGAWIIDPHFNWLEIIRDLDDQGLITL